MRSRTARLATAAVAVIAIVASAFFLVHSEKHLVDLRATERAFDVHVRDAAGALADLRVAEGAYVAEGQGAPFWMTKVSTLSAPLGDALDSLRQTAGSAPARASLDEASAALVEFGNVDRRVREYIRAGQELMAGDIIFTEGVESAAAAGRHVESARMAERQAYDVAEAAVRKQEMFALGGTASVVALLVVGLGILGAQRPSESAAAGTIGLDLVASALQTPAVQQPSPGPVHDLALKDVAQLCTEFGRVRDQGDLQMLAARTATLLDASGLIVWMGSAAGADLRPVLAHGYPQQVLARMASVPRTDDNAAAAAYRTGELQIVLARPGARGGAVVAPILSVEGCVGALSAEIRHGGEASETVQALAVLFAAQLAGVLASAPAADTGDDRIAASS